jgi:hypothetical protein
VVALLRDDRMRGFRIEVETDSLVEADQAQERADVTAFVQAIGGFFKEFGPIVAQMPPLAPMASQLLQFSVRRFKVGAQLEEIIEKSMEQVEERLNNPAPPQPSPDELEKTKQAQIKTGAEVQKASLEGQISQLEANAKQQQIAAEAQAEQQRAFMEQQAKKMDMVLKFMEHQQTVREHHLEAQQTERAHELNMEVAEHKAKEAKKPKGDSK